MRIAVSRAPGTERVVTPLELFFDLVYVFAIGQLSHHLLEHVDLRTGAETAIMTLAVAYAWYMVAWGANWLDPDRLPVRLLLVGLMFASLLMSAAIPDAFDGRAWLFVTGYLLIQIGRSLFLIIALRGRALGEHFVNDLVWEVVVGGLWIAGAISDGDARLALWGAAVVATHAGTWTLHWLPGRGRAIDLSHTEIAGGHLVERFRLFFIIALGETVLTMGTAFSDEPFELVGHVDGPVDGARAHRHRGRRRAGDRPSRRRRDARLHATDVRRAGALPARSGHLSARDSRSRPAVTAGGRGGSGDPRRCDRAAHADRRDRGCDRCARRGRGGGHGPG
jgi:hypothetical protein